MWSLPSVDEWLAELHGLSPPQLSMPVAGPAVTKRAPPPLCSAISGRLLLRQPLVHSEDYRLMKGPRLG